MPTAFGKYVFYDRPKLRRAQKKAGKGADVNDIAREYLKMGGFLKDEKDKERITKIGKEKEEKKEKGFACPHCAKVCKSEVGLKLHLKACKEK